MSATATEAETIDLGRAIGLAEAARLMRGRGGKAPSVVTVRRWASAKPKGGCWPVGKTGPRLQLHCVRCNGELVTLPEWVEAFERERLRLGDRAPVPAVDQARPAGKRGAAHARAEARLDRAGVGKKGE